MTRSTSKFSRKRLQHSDREAFAAQGLGTNTYTLGVLRPETYLEPLKHPENCGDYPTRRGIWAILLGTLEVNLLTMGPST